MTQDEIIRMARDADKDFAIALIALEQITPFLERFAALVAAHEKKFWMAQIEVECNEAVLAEREACAKVADGELTNTNMLTSYPPKSSAAWHIAAAIRARSTKEQ